MPTPPPPSPTTSTVSRLVALGRGDRAGGIGLAGATLVALVWANWPGSLSYQTTWGSIPRLSTSLGLHLTWRGWVNDALMVGFFALVGLEIRREMTVGELRSWRRSATPILAAAAGMLVPALLYLAILHGQAGSRGWGIPMATDVAFALGALALVVPGASPRTRVFLMTLAVADDIGSVIVLVCFYSQHVSVGALVLGLLCLALMGVSAWRGWLPPSAPLVLGAATWWAFVHAGVEPAVVGVAVGLCLPERLPRGSRPTPRQLERGPRHREQQLEPWVNLLILPVFALANAGLRLAGSGIGTSAALTVLVAVVIARVVGKLAGITGATTAVTRLAGPGYDPRLPARQHVVVGALGSVGFTVPLLIIQAALPPGSLTVAATAGLLIGTVLGIAVAALVARSARRPARLL